MHLNVCKDVLEQMCYYCYTKIIQLEHKLSELIFHPVQQ